MRKDEIYLNSPKAFTKETRSKARVLFCPHCCCPCPGDTLLQRATVTQIKPKAVLTHMLPAAVAVFSIHTRNSSSPRSPNPAWHLFVTFLELFHYKKPQEHIDLLFEGCLSAILRPQAGQM